MLDRAFGTQDGSPIGWRTERVLNAVPGSLARS
jgi:hypothetical protein